MEKFMLKLPAFVSLFLTSSFCHFVAVPPPHVFSFVLLIFGCLKKRKRLINGNTSARAMSLSLESTKSSNTTKKGGCKSVLPVVTTTTNFYYSSSSYPSSSSSSVTLFFSNIKSGNGFPVLRL